MKTVIDRFWEKVDTSGDCWLWTGEVNSTGYGRFDLWRANKRTRALAHRFAYIITTTEPLSPAQVIRHACDTPRCVNPEHLTTGTQRQNMHDSIERGRFDTSGLFADYVKECATCGQEFVGKSRSRYCEACPFDAKAYMKAWHARRKAREASKTHQAAA